MATGITNKDIPGDSTPQPNYMKLQPRERDLVDQAIYVKVIQRQGDRYDLTDTEKNNLAAQNLFAPPGSKSTPRTDQVEQDIERMREYYAGKLLQHDPVVTAELTTASRKAPEGAEARRALNAIIKFHGDECGCGGIPMTAEIINHVITTAQKSGNAR
ncbi:MAG: hypothetical protein ACKVOE_05470 [Rickettsiales bacterium]